MDSRKLLTAAGLIALAMLTGTRAHALPPGVTRVPCYRDAPGLALTDVTALPSKLRPTSFYLHDPVGSKESIGMYSFTMNAVLSRSPTIIKPRVIQGGGVTVLWWDLGEIWSDPEDFKRGWRILQDLAYFDPFYHEPAISPQVKKVTKWELIRVPHYLHTDGQWYDGKWVEKEVETVEHRGIQFAVGAGGAGPLQALSEFCGGSLLPIAHGPWFLTNAWSTTDHSGLQGSKYGYYQLAGIGDKGGSHESLQVRAAQVRVGGETLTVVDLARVVAQHPEIAHTVGRRGAVV